MRKGEYDWFKLWERSYGWASVLPTEDWRRPYRLMGAIEYDKQRPLPVASRYVEFDCSVEFETDLAWLVEIEGEKYWLPKSRCRLSDDEHHIEIEHWLWQQKQHEPVDNESNDNAGATPWDADAVAGNSEPGLRFRTSVWDTLRR